jgi:hypothetical protein
MRKTIFLLLILVAFSGCQPWDAWGKEEAPARSGFVRDTARVVSVDAALGQAVLEFRGQRVKAFWQTEVVLAQGGIVSQEDSTGLKLPVGQYKAPVVKQREFKANPGDVIQFVGLWTNDHIFLTTISVQPQ